MADVLEYKLGNGNRGVTASAYHLRGDLGDHVATALLVSLCSEGRGVHSPHGGECLVLISDYIEFFFHSGDICVCYSVSNLLNIQ